MKVRILFPLVVALTGCSEVAAPCSGAAAGILLTILDGATSGPVDADSVVAVARDDAFADTVRFSNSPPDLVTTVRLAEERPGIYELRVSATGYESWAESGIRVRDGRCNVDTVDITARMSRALR